MLVFRDFAVFHDGFVGDVSNEGASQSVLWCCIVIHQAGLSLGVLHEVNVWCKGISEQSEVCDLRLRLCARRCTEINSDSSWRVGAKKLQTSIMSLSCPRSQGEAASKSKREMKLPDYLSSGCAG